MPASKSRKMKVCLQLSERKEARSSILRENLLTSSNLPIQRGSESILIASADLMIKDRRWETFTSKESPLIWWRSKNIKTFWDRKCRGNFSKIPCLIPRWPPWSTLCKNSNKIRLQKSRACWTSKVLQELYWISKTLSKMTRIHLPRERVRFTSHSHHRLVRKEIQISHLWIAQAIFKSIYPK